MADVAAFHRTSDWSQVRAAVAGFGVSGFAAADNLTHLGATVTALDEGTSETKAENLATLGSIPDRYDSFGYADARTVALEDGFLRQHVIVASRGGKTAHVPAILRVYVEDRAIHRIEEYFDRGQLMAALS